MAPLAPPVPTPLREPEEFVVYIDNEVEDTKTEKLLVHEIYGVVTLSSKCNISVKLVKMK